MSEILQLFGQIFLIAIIQIVSDAFIDKGSMAMQSKLVNIACFLGSLYLVLNFLFTYIFGNFSTAFNFPAF
ncbi:MAG: hypothetical protein FWF57_06240 [Defluviitaleaceae bacterium]|nr:hypothetical protein [Defluviitaleaceae bacterium]